MRRTVYMDKNMLTLFINTARSEIVVNKYADMEEKGKKVYLAEKNRAGFYYLAYYDALLLLNLEDEYARFALVVLDSQMEYIEECGKYDETTIRRYTDDYKIDDFNLYLFESCFTIEENIFKNGWDFKKLFEKCTEADDKIFAKVLAKRRDFKQDACKKLFDIWQRERNIKMRMRSYATLEEVKKHARFPTKYRCGKCGATYYSDTRGQYKPAPKCLKCGDNTKQEWIWWAYEE